MLDDRERIYIVTKIDNSLLFDYMYNMYDTESTIIYIRDTTIAILF